MKAIDPSGSPSLQIPDNNSNNESAANLVRKKIDSIYDQEPDVVDEAIESIQEPVKERSKHQRFMANLASSGKSFAEIQTEWHNYYIKLTDKEKHDVWNEFYSAQSKSSHRPQTTKIPDNLNNFVVSSTIESPNIRKRPETIADLKKQISAKVRSREKLTKNQNFKSIMFGLSVGLLTVFVMLFGFFNERFIAPFITPSKNVSSTPLISDGISGAVGSDPKLIIPKINVELPVVYDVKTVNEDDVQEGLERGVVHYATTSSPGELGNGAIFGHSSNNILNRGQYKFAFVLLNRLEDGDTFYLEKDGIRYVYKVFRKEVVSPTEVSVLNDVPGRDSTMSLITCDPPGTTINRLVVWGEQISPNPINNIASTAKEQTTTPETLAGNPESLWSRIWNSVF